MFPCSMLVLSSCCSIFNDRFFAPLFAALDYYITSLRVCQEVFRNFSKSFFELSLSTTLIGATCLLYYILPVLSTPFSNFFEIFFTSRIRRPHQALVPSRKKRHPRPRKPRLRRPLRMCRCGKGGSPRARLAKSPHRNSGSYPWQ